MQKNYIVLHPFTSIYIENGCWRRLVQNNRLTLDLIWSHNKIVRKTHLQNLVKSKGKKLIGL